MVWNLPKITRVDEYEGQSAVAIAATQLSGTGYTDSQARRIVKEWEEFFDAGPSSITDLQFLTRTPKRLFAALRGQTQLGSLKVKWGDYADLTVLTGMTVLKTLHLGGASAVEDLGPLSHMSTVQELSVEGLRRVSDLSPVAGMSSVSALELGGDWMSPRVAHVASFAFLRQMPQLRKLLLHTIAPDDLDYSPILELPNLEWVRAMQVSGMRPSFETLKANTPWRS